MLKILARASNHGVMTCTRPGEMMKTMKDIDGDGDDILPRRSDIFVRVPLLTFTKFSDFLTRNPCCFELYINAAGLECSSISSLNAIAEFARLHGSSIRVHGPFMDLLPGAEDRAVINVVLDRFCRAMDFCIALGAQSMVLHAAFDPLNYGYRKKEWLARSMDTWTEFAAKYPDRCPRILIENVFDTDTRLLLELFEVLPSSRFGACFDVGHWHVYARQSLESWFKDLGHRIEEVHMHDNDGSGDQHAAIGKGTIDFGLLSDILGAQQLRPAFTIENYSLADVRQSFHAICRFFPFG